ncbi:MAG: hypothetical protein J0L88_15980, partial [Xanthomonadales bacterium]|nr:hypothetical protein [Xanthomonadales bacterium]
SSNTLSTCCSIAGGISTVRLKARLSDAVATPSATATPASATTLVATRLVITPPAYTTLPARTGPALDIEAPEGSRLRWQLRFDAEPQAVALEFHDGSRLALERAADGWNGEHVLAASTLYRIDVDGVAPLADARLHRLEAIPDRAPEIRVLAPEQTLTVLDAHQAAWDVVVEASDDHALGNARIALTLAQGSGEQVTVKEQEILLRPAPGGDARQRRYRQRLDLDALGFVQGDDLIVRVRVADTRTPTPNIAQSASFILRWPPEPAAEADGVDGIVQKVLPAYFRSQRQIILDTEALVAARATLSADAFMQRSDAIGVDQKILRLRYGQFLGEEFESGGAPKATAQDAGTRGDGDPDDHDHGDKAGSLPEGHAADDGHDHGTPAFGDAGALVGEYGHAHDHAEAATLLDPATKRILKAALGEMWQAELHLRTGRPNDALPFENRALGYIKQVQQASRIYLARVGLDLPPVDESRRLSGERKDLRDVHSPLAAAARDDAALLDFHAALEHGGAADPTQLMRWLRAREKDLPDALAVYAALDAWQRDRACTACRDRLLDRLWPLLPAVAPAAHSRPEPDAAGAAYLDALRGEAGP